MRAGAERAGELQVFTVEAYVGRQILKLVKQVSTQLQSLTHFVTKRAYEIKEIAAVTKPFSLDCINIYDST